MGKLHPYNGISPRIAVGVFLAPGTQIIGDVTIEEGCRIWSNSTLRGDVCYITIGKNSDINDRTVIHVDRHGLPTIVGSNVIIGRNSLLHACTLENNVFIGDRCIVMDGAIMEIGSVLESNSLLTKCKIVREGELWGGNPARMIRQLNENDIASMKNYWQQRAKSCDWIIPN